MHVLFICQLVFAIFPCDIFSTNGLIVQVFSGRNGTVNECIQTAMTAASVSHFEKHFQAMTWCRYFLHMHVNSLPAL